MIVFDCSRESAVKEKGGGDEVACIQVIDS